MKIKNLAAGILAGVVLFTGFGMIGFASNGFTEMDVTEWTLKTRNDENLFKVENYTLKSEKADDVTVTALNDGRITINGENTEKTELSVEVGNLSLAAGKYTFSSGWEDAADDTAYLKFVTSDGTYTFDFGTGNGTYTFTSDVEGKVILVLAAEEEFDKVEMQPTVAKGDKAIDFYK